MNIQNRESTSQSLLADAARKPVIAGVAGIAVGAVMAGAAYIRRHRQDRMTIESLEATNTSHEASIAYLTKDNEKMSLEVEHLQQEARTDSLTELSNHRHLEQLFETHVNEGAPFGLIVFDLENFKAVNDELGHGEGDNQLRLFARIIQGTRDDDEPVYLGDAANNEAIAIRTGGDEFALLVAFPTGSPAADSADRRHAPETVGFETILSDITHRIIEEYRQHPAVQSFNMSRPYEPQLGARANFAMYQPGETLRSLTQRADVVKNGHNISHNVRQTVNPGQMNLFKAGDLG